MAGDLIQDTTKEERQRREKVNTLPPSIFNDVIGPVMRGPSSSHVAGAFRISSLVRQSLRGKIRKVLVDFDPNGSLAESYHGHGTDMGFVAGILNMELTDPEVFRACEFAKEKGMDIQFRIVEYGASHPNFYRIYAEDEMGNCCSWDALSTGGGMIEMIRYNGHEIHIIGDYHELLITVQTDEIVPAVKEILLKWENCNICSRSCRVSGRMRLWIWHGGSRPGAAYAWNSRTSSGCGISCAAEYWRTGRHTILRCNPGKINVMKIQIQNVQEKSRS